MIHSNLMTDSIKTLWADWWTNKAALKSKKRNKNGRIKSLEKLKCTSLCN